MLIVTASLGPSLASYMATASQELCIAAAGHNQQKQLNQYGVPTAATPSEKFAADGGHPNTSRSGAGSMAR
jgi:hypothetical protein